SLRSGEITGVVGENGNGKTTLLRIFAGETSADEGWPEYPGMVGDALTPYQIKQQVAFIPQRLRPWHGTLLQNLKYAAANKGFHGEANEQRVNFVVHRLGLTRFQHLGWKQLSSGYKLRFELARMVVWRPRLLVLDEPIANLDLNAQQQFLQDLVHLAASIRYPMGIVLSSQQLHQIEAVSEQIVFLRNGKPLFAGATKNVGSDRASNTFQVGGSFSLENLLQATQGLPEIRVEESGTNFTVHTATAVNGRQLLETLFAARLEVTFFRDISFSTRQLLAQTL
ncbi:MAG: ATP-binding cassette domain-containing protein, partial [Salibacteraceae bacterium]